jgi:hypothetical protein
LDIELGMEKMKNQKAEYIDKIHADKYKAGVLIKKC